MTLKFTEKVQTRYGIMYVPQNDDVIGRSLRVYGEWAEEEIRVLSSFISNRSEIIDVGANIGTHALGFAALSPCVTINCFEAQNDVSLILAANIGLNQIKNAKVFNCVVGSEIGVEFISPNDLSKSSNIGAFRVSSGGEFPILKVPLDSFNFKNRISLIKIDVEGAEVDVLRGALKLIERDSPTIFCEVLGLKEAREILNVLKSFPYRFFSLITNPYNQKNYRGVTQNIWTRHEAGILAVNIDNISPKLPLISEDLSCFSKILI